MSVFSFDALNWIIYSTNIKEMITLGFRTYITKCKVCEMCTYKIELIIWESYVISICVNSDERNPLCIYMWERSFESAQSLTAVAETLYLFDVHILCLHSLYHCVHLFVCLSVCLYVSPIHLSACLYIIVYCTFVTVPCFITFEGLLFN